MGGMLDARTNVTHMRMLQDFIVLYVDPPSALLLAVVHAVSGGMCIMSINVSNPRVCSAMPHVAASAYTNHIKACECAHWYA